MAVHRCPICGADKHACGPSGVPARVTITSTDRSTTVGELSTYTFTNDDGREVTLRLTEEDAKKRGLTSTKKAAQPSDKSRSAARDK